jgi:hypothetical protein
MIGPWNGRFAWLSIATGGLSLIVAVGTTVLYTGASFQIFQPIVLALIGLGGITLGISMLLRLKRPTLANILALLNVCCYIVAVAIIFRNLLSLQS